MAVRWEDQGIILSTRRYGENDAIVTVLTEHHGRHAGLVKGGTAQRHRAVLQAGNLVRVDWRARLEGQLGHYTVELVRAFAGAALDAARRLAGLASLCAMVDATLPERENHDEVFR